VKIVLLQFSRFMTCQITLLFLLKYLISTCNLITFRNFIVLKVDTPTEKKSEPEPTFEILTNPARVVPAQEKFIKFLQDSRYVPVKLAPSGFVLLKDLRPTEPEVLAITDTPASTTSTAGGSGPGLQSSSSAMAVDEEPQPPQPFEYTS
jgi:26S proteasome regulatory subunit N2